MTSKTLYLGRCRIGSREALMQPIYSTLLSLCLGCALAQTGYAQGPDADLQTHKNIELASRFETLHAVAEGPVLSGSVYGSVRYTIGSNAQREYITKVIQYMATTLPDKFGNSSGAYTITVTLRNRNDKVLAREPIVAFSWTRESGFLFIEKAVTEVLKTSWKGTLVHQMPIKDSNERMRLE